MTLKAKVLHLGAHKTGTSLVQKFLRDKQAACRNAKIYAMTRGDGDALIGWGRASETKAEGLLEKVAEAEGTGAEWFVLSHENALGRPFRKDADSLYPEAIRRVVHLRKAMGDDVPVKAIYYIRNQAAFIESYYLQTVHEGDWHDFQTFLASLGSQVFSWRPVYDSLCELFGAENVILRSFEQDIAGGQEAYIKQFLTSATSANLKPFGSFEYKPVRNPSIGDRGLELARGINPLLKTPAERKLMRKFLQNHFSNLDYPRPELFSKEEIAALTEKFSAENAEILAKSAELAKPVE